MVAQVAAAGAGAAAGGMSFGEMAGLAGLSGAMNFGMGSYATGQANAQSQANSIRQFIMQDYFMNKQNEYNKPVNQVKRLREANLNPNLVYGDGSVSNTSAGGFRRRTRINRGSCGGRCKDKACRIDLGDLSGVLSSGSGGSDVDVWTDQYSGCVGTPGLRGKYGTDQSGTYQLFLSESISENRSGQRYFVRV